MTVARSRSPSSDTRGRSEFPAGTTLEAVKVAMKVVAFIVVDLEVYYETRKDAEILGKLILASEENRRDPELGKSRSNRQPMMNERPLG